LIDADGALEDLHLALIMACEGTAASRFIENDQYEVDESATDATVGTADLLQKIDQCRVFEVTITFSKLEIPADVCPRCETAHDAVNEKNDNGWATW
jgi:hypothetical protein